MEMMSHMMFIFEYEIDDQLYEDKLGYYSSSFRVGQDITFIL